MLNASQTIANTTPRATWSKEECQMVKELLSTPDFISSAIECVRLGINLTELFTQATELAKNGTDPVEVLTLLTELAEQGVDPVEALEKVSAQQSATN